jgi:hypothetical protein
MAYVKRRHRKKSPYVRLPSEACGDSKRREVTMSPQESESNMANDPIFNRIIKEHAERLGKPVEEIIKEAEKGPRFLAAAKEKSRKSGRSAQQILRDDIRAIEASNYPSSECATPEDLEEFAASGELTKEVEAHLRVCENCSTLLSLARPQPEQLERFMDEVRAALSADLPRVGETVGRIAG